MKWMYRIGSYLLGVVIIAFGGALTINSDLGASPFNFLSFTVSRVTGVQLSITAFLMFTSYVLIQMLLLKKDFKPIQCLQVLFAVIFGHFLGFFTSLIQIETDLLIVRFPMVITGFSCIALGVFLTVTPRLVPLAPDGLTDAVATKIGSDFGKAKNIMDATVVTVAVVLLLVSGTNFAGLGVGTILSALLVGRIIFVLNHFFKKKLERLLFG